MKLLEASGIFLAMEKIYNPKLKQLEFYHEKANSKFWDKLWHSTDLKNRIVCKNNPLIKKILKKYATKNSKILEAGCGNGHIVYFIDKLGYDVHGVDFAKKTVNEINKRGYAVNSTSVICFARHFVCHPR